MARKIAREEEVVSPEEAKSEVKEEAKVEAKPEVKPVVKVEPLNYTQTLPNRINATAIRVVGSFCFVNEGVRVKRLVIDKTKPVIVTLRQ